MSDEGYVVQGVESVSSETLRRRYKVLAQLGAGGMALVHLAVARAAAGAEKLVVLKSIRPDLAEDTKVITMFTDEARLAVQLSHPNVVQTYDVIKVNALPIIVMEYLEGQSLSACVSGGLPFALRLRVIVEILSGLEYAHALKGLDGAALGIVHRDMSPQNVIITYDGHVKLLDFGIAKAIGHAAQTEAGEIKGKLRYMAPEQMIARRPIDRRADVFSVGIMLWETLAQRRLWDGISDVEVIQTVLESGVPAPSTLTADVDPELERVCMKAVAEEPDERYSSALAMQEDLSKVLEWRGIGGISRDLASWLESKFTERRARMREIIRSQLEQEHARIVEIGKDPSTAGSTNMELNSVASRTVPTPFGSRTAVEPTRKRWIGWAGAGLLATLALSFALRATIRPSHHPVSSASAQASAAASTPPSPAPSASASANDDSATPNDIDVSITASPKAARLFLDGNEITNPYSTKRLGDGTRHSLRIEARGYVPKTIEVPFGREPIRLAVALDLQPTPGVAPRKPPPTTPPTAQSAASQCDTPFYRDSEGIMHPRPECIK